MNSNAAKNDIVIGLKTEVSRQVGMKLHQNNISDHHLKSAVDSWKLLYSVGVRDELIELIWKNICDDDGFGNVYFNCMSADVGEVSVIKDYTNSKGITKLAHYSVNGCYIGSINQLGNEPVSYKGNFLITRKHFEIDLEKLPSFNTSLYGKPKIEELFTPKSNRVQPEQVKVKKVKKVTTKIFADFDFEIESEDEDEDVPLNQLISRQNAFRK